MKTKQKDKKKRMCFLFFLFFCFCFVLVCARACMTNSSPTLFMCVCVYVCVYVCVCVRRRRRKKKRWKFVYLSTRRNAVNLYFPHRYRQPRGLHTTWSGESGYGKKSIVDTSTDILLAARENPINFAPPLVYYVFTMGVGNLYEHIYACMFICLFCLFVWMYRRPISYSTRPRYILLLPSRTCTLPRSLLAYTQSLFGVGFR